MRTWRNSRQGRREERPAFFRVSERIESALKDCAGFRWCHVGDVFVTLCVKRKTQNLISICRCGGTADALVSGSSEEIRVGSNPVTCTIKGRWKRYRPQIPWFFKGFLLFKGRIFIVRFCRWKMGIFRYWIDLNSRENENRPRIPTRKQKNSIRHIESSDRNILGFFISKNRRKENESYKNWTGNHHSL